MSQTHLQRQGGRSSRVVAVVVLLLAVAATLLYMGSRSPGEEGASEEVASSDPQVPALDPLPIKLPVERQEQADRPVAEQEFPAHTSVSGRVADPSGNGIAGATVRLRWLVRGMWPFPGGRLAEVRTGPDGRFGLELDELLDGRTRTERLRLELYGEATARGYRRGRLSEPARLSTWQADQLAVRIVLIPGGSIRGRVVDERGLPVGEATVRLHDVDGKPLSGGDTTDAAGRYEVVAERDGEYLLSAGRFNVGAGRSPPFSFRTDQDLDLDDLMVLGDGILEGRLTNPRGEPLDGVEVFAHPQGSLATPYFELVNRRVIRFPDLGAATVGLPRSEAVTDAAGRFRFAGLMPGRYFLLFPGTLGDDRRERALVETGRRNVQVVAERYRVLARVVDESGRVRRDASVQFQFRKPHQLGLPPSSVTPEGRFVADRLSPGSLMEILVRTEEGLEASQPVEVEEGTYDTEIEVALVGDPDARPGIIRIEPVCPDGTPIRRFVASVRPSGGAALTGFAFTFQTEVESGQALPPVPPGRYVVRLESVNEPLSWHGRRHSWFFPAAQEVSIDSGSEQVVPIEVRRGGRLRVRFRTDGNLPAEGFEGTWQNWTPLGGSPSRLLFQHDATAELPVPWQPFRLHPAVPAACTDLLEPGEGDLSIDVAGFVPVTRRLTLLPGGFIDVEILLAPR